MSQRELDGQQDKGDARDEAFGDLDARDADDVRGGDGRTDPGDDDDKMSGGELAVLLVHGKPVIKN